MTKTFLERAIIARQTEAEFAAEVAGAKRANGKHRDALHYQERASYWAREVCERLCHLVNATKFQR